MTPGVIQSTGPIIDQGPLPRRSMRIITSRIIVISIATTHGGVEISVGVKASRLERRHRYRTPSVCVCSLPLRTGYKLQVLYLSERCAWGCACDF